MHKDKIRSNKAAWIIASTTVVASTALQANGLSIASGPLLLAGTAVAMAASNTRALAFGAATATTATVGVIAGDYLRDHKKTANNSVGSKNVLVIPNETLAAKAFPYKFEAI